MNLTLQQYIEGVRNGSLKPQEVFQYYMGKSKQDTLRAWVRVHEDYGKKHIDAFSHRILHGAPIGIKDNILTKGYETTCASQILSGYIPPYSATCFKQLEQAGGLMIGKTNMDEFAMGSSTEYSAFGDTCNPCDPSRVPGGSSGGSAVAVADDQCIAALGTDTGGSVRQPASFCGIVGVKPTYGRVSRYGVQAMTASFNQVGVLTKSVRDSAFLLSIISGYDENDAKSITIQDDKEGRVDSLGKRTWKDFKIAVPQQFFGDGIDKRVEHLIKEKIAYMKSTGAYIEYVDIPLLRYAIPVYYILVFAEVSSEMARFDGIRYGLQDSTEVYDSIFDYYDEIRNRGFGPEVKRRVLLGSYVLSAGFYDQYYHKAQKIQKSLIKNYEKIFNDFDIIVGPTTPSLARKRGERINDPLKVYLEDIYTVPANVTGIPALSLPIGYTEEDNVSLPVGMQIMAKWRDEGSMFQLAHLLEQCRG